MVGAMEANGQPPSPQRARPEDAAGKTGGSLPAACPRVLFHCHCFPANPERFPLDPDTRLYPGSVEYLQAFALRLGFDYATALSPFEVPPGRCTSRIDPGEDSLEWLAEQARGRDKILLFASLDPGAAESCARLESAVRRGFTGVKFHPPICRFSIDPERDREFYQLLSNWRLPLLIHTGVFSSPEPWPLEEYHPLRIDRLAGLFPEIPVIFAHGGGRAFCREVLGVLQNNPNTYLDLTHSLDARYAWHVPLPDMEAFFDRAGPARIIYGTDHPWFAAEDFSRDLAYLQKLGLGREDLDLVLGGTFLRILEDRAKQ